MKAFQFRLEPALRWRATQLRLEREAVAHAASHLAELQGRLNDRHSELQNGAAGLIPAGSAAFGTWEAFVDRCRRRIKVLEDELRQAQKALALRTQKMVDAHRKLRALENLRGEDHAVWTRELGREVDAFASEAHLARLVRYSGGRRVGI